MARPRAYATESVLDAARDTFWEGGYEATSLADLEASTGLSRSSLYQAFGSKRGLFDAAIERYVERNIEPVLAAMEAPGAGVEDVRAYLRLLSQTFRDDPDVAMRGCLVVNTMAELGSRDSEARITGIAHRDRVANALANALQGASGHGRRERREADRHGRMLCSAVMGALVAAHLDPAWAADVCDDLARALPGPRS